MAKKRRPPPDDDSDRIKFPFGESSKSYPGGFDPSASDNEPPKPRKRSKKKAPPKRGKRPRRELPNQPPGGDPSDDASLDMFDSGVGSTSGLFDSSVTGSSDLQSVEPPSGGGESLEDLVELDPDAFDSHLSVSERIGPVNPSGPLVIVEDDDDDEGPDSNRFQASIVDDSARLAGSMSARAPKRSKKKKEKKTREGKRSWRQEPLESVDPDEAVPFPERRSRSRSGRGAPAPAPASKAALVVVVILALLALGGVGVGLEVRRQNDLLAQREALEAGFDQTLRDALAEERAARATELNAAREQVAAEREAAHAAELKRLEDDAVARERRAAEQARRDAAREHEQALAAERQRIERETRDAVEVELARARDEGSAARDAELEAAVEDALAAERERAEEEAKKARDEADKKHAQTVEDLKRRYKRDLEAATTRAEEAELANEMQGEREDLLDEVEGGEGGSASEGVDDWDEFFDEGGGGDGSDSGGDDSGDEISLEPIEAAWAWLRQKFHGHVGYKNLSHFSRGEFDDLRKTRHELRAKIEFRDWLFANDDRSVGLKLVAGVDVMEDDDGYTVKLPQSIDEDQRRRPVAALDETYLNLVVDWLDVRAGWQIYSWGTGDLFNPTNILNPADFSDLFDARRIPVLSAAITLDFTDFSVQLISIPTFTRSRLVLAEKRFDTLRDSPIPILEPDDPEEGIDEAQWAARVRASIKGWDVSLMGFSGYNDVPSPRFVLQDPSDPLTIAVVPVFERQQVIGGDFATTLGILGAEGTLGEILGGIQVHGEAAHFWTDGEETDDFASYVFGFNYQFVDLIFEHDVTIFLEYAGEIITNPTTNELDGGQIDRTLTGAVLSRIQYDVNEDLTFEFNAAIVVDGPENGVFRPGVTYNATDEVTVSLTGDVFFGDEETFFGQYRKDSRVIFELNYNF